MELLIKGTLAQNDYDLEVDNPNFIGDDRIYFFRKIDESYNLCPSNATLILELSKTADQYKAKLETRCFQTPFQIMAQSALITSVMEELAEKMEKQLSIWRNQRFKQTREYDRVANGR